MRRLRRPPRLLLAGALAWSAGIIPASAQAPPPPEMNWWIVMDVGPLPAPVVCGCVTNPFSVTPPRPGYGYGSGPAAPDSDAPLTRFTAVFQARLDAAGRANLPVQVENGLNGNPNDSIATAWLISGGTAVARDEKQATAWFFLAAQQGHVNAYGALGHRYMRGLGIDRNVRAAAHWYYLGALHGDTASMSALGGLYAAGQGVTRDWTRAVAWWNRAGNWRFVGDAYACGLGVEQNHEHAAAAYQRAVEHADVVSSIQLGNMYAGGCAVPPSEDAAVKAYQRAADQGYPEAQIALSRMYLAGTGVQVVPYQAYFWARLAELRLPPGALRREASRRAALAAKALSAFEIRDADTFVKGVIAGGAEPMNK